MRTNIREGRKILAVTNTLAYFAAESEMKERKVLLYWQLNKNLFLQIFPQKLAPQQSGRGPWFTNPFTVVINSVLQSIINYDHKRFYNTGP